MTKPLARARLDAERTTAFVCGPEIMMRHTAEALVGRGVDPSNVLVSLERNMACAIGHCGHCQLGALFLCRDGPVLPWSGVAELLEIRGR